MVAVAAKVMRLRGTEPRIDPSVAVGAAMREAREVAGLDPHEATRRLNCACGTSIIEVGLLLAWEAGAEKPDAVTFIRAVRLAGEQAGLILARLG